MPYTKGRRKRETKEEMINKKGNKGEFPGDLVVRIWCLHFCGLGLIPGWGTPSGLMIWPEGKKGGGGR